MNVKKADRTYICMLTILVISTTILFIVLLKQYWKFTADDSFITFRYAKHLVQYGAPTFNLTGVPAEGYTSFLWLIVMCIPHALNLEPVLFSKLAGVFFSVCMMIYAAKLLFLFLAKSKPIKKYLLGACLILYIVIHRGTAKHTVSGMETALFSFLITFFSYNILFLIKEYTTKRSCTAAFLALLVGLTHPEGNLFSLVSLGTLYFMLQQHKHRKKLIIHTLLFYFMPGLLYFLWRWNYYGLLLPLPFYIKVGHTEWFAGFNKTYSFFHSFRYFTLLPLVTGLFIYRKNILPIFIGTLSICVFFMFPKHIMSYAHRYLYPWLPFLSVMIMLGLISLISLAKKLPHKIKLIFIIAIALCLAENSFNILKKTIKRIPRTLQYSNGLYNAHITLGKALKEITADDDTTYTLVISDAGAVPYYSEFYTIDSLGLNEPYIATTHDHAPEYILNQTPDIVILLSLEENVFSAILDWASDLYTASVRTDYKKLGAMQFDEDYYLWIMGKESAELSKKLTAHLDQTSPNL